MELHTHVLPAKFPCLEVILRAQRMRLRGELGDDAQGLAGLALQLSVNLYLKWKGTPRPHAHKAVLLGSKKFGSIKSPIGDGVGRGSHRHSRGYEVLPLSKYHAKSFMYNSGVTS